MKKCVLFLVLGVFAAGTAVRASSLLIDRGLPTTNLNNAAGASRSNVTWASTEETKFTGDDFIIGKAGETYHIDSLTVWGAQYDPLSLDIDHISLYMAKAGEAMQVVSTGTVLDNSNTNSNPNITHQFVAYPGTLVTEYQGNGNVSYPIAQTTFGGLDFLVEGGVKYYFGVMGDHFLWWNHASNAALSGSPQQGADDRYLEFDSANLLSVLVLDSNGNGWDKSSDINVQVNGSQVPEPATLALLGAGLAGAALRRRKQLMSPNTRRPRVSSPVE